MRRALAWILKALLVRFVWNRAMGGVRRRTTRVFTLDNLLGQQVGTWWRMRKLK